MMYIGVDPGNDGGLSLIDSDKGFAVEWQRMPDVKGIEAFFRDAFRAAESGGQKLVCIFEEHKGGKTGVTSAAAHRSAGRYLGMVEMICTAYEITLIRVTPQEWKAHYGLIKRTPKGGYKPSDKEKRDAAKAESIKLCKMLFPGINLLATPRCTTEHDGIAESLLLAKYGLRKRLS